jgi:hypothetical protein
MSSSEASRFGGGLIGSTPFELESMSIRGSLKFDDLECLIAFLKVAAFKKEI